MKYIKIINIIDKSGSMDSIKGSAIEGFNTFILEQRKELGKTLITTVLFNDEYEISNENLDINECQLLNNNNYKPNNGTALYDAIGFMIEREIDILAETEINNRPEKVIVTILTDGEENSSRYFYSFDIKKMITEMTTEFGWEFIFLAANQDSFTSAENIGISSTNAYNFTATLEGVADAYQTISRCVSDYRK